MRPLTAHRSSSNSHLLTSAASYNPLPPNHCPWPSFTIYGVPAFAQQLPKRSSPAKNEKWSKWRGLRAMKQTVMIYLSRRKIFLSIFCRSTKLWDTGVIIRNAKWTLQRSNFWIFSNLYFYNYHFLFWKQNWSHHSHSQNTFVQSVFNVQMFSLPKDRPLSNDRQPLSHVARNWLLQMCQLQFRQQHQAKGETSFSRTSKLNIQLHKLISQVG